MAHPDSPGRDFWRETSLLSFSIWLFFFFFGTLCTSGKVPARSLRLKWLVPNSAPSSRDGHMRGNHRQESECMDFKLKRRTRRPSTPSHLFLKPQIHYYVESVEKNPFLIWPTQCSLSVKLPNCVLSGSWGDSQKLTEVTWDDLKCVKFYRVSVKMEAQELRSVWQCPTEPET